MPEVEQVIHAPYNWEPATCNVCETFNSACLPILAPPVVTQRQNVLFRLVWVCDPCSRTIDRDAMGTGIQLLYELNPAYYELFYDCATIALVDVITLDGDTQEAKDNFARQLDAAMEQAITAALDSTFPPEGC